MPSFVPVPAVRPCPLCGVAMQASKSREDLAKFDTFRCLACHTTIVETPKATDADQPPQKRAGRTD